MTRESKLALIIGFVLVLVVGVLVSDHFSQANSMTLEGQQPEHERIVSPITDLGTRGGDLAQSSNQPDHRAQTQGSPYQPMQIRSNGEQYAKGSSSGDEDSLLEQALKKAGEAFVDTTYPGAVQTSRDVAKTTNREPRSLPGSNQSRTISYTVVSGDSLIKIARRMLGDGERYKQIHKLNADKLGPDAILKIGMVLKLPGDAKNTKQSGAGTSRLKPNGTSSSSTKTYTVLPNDTLGEISMKLLGTSKRVNEFVKLNNLDDANDIRVGMVLKVPSK